MTHTDRINAAIEHSQPVVWRQHLTASSWHSCDRAMWYSLRNASWQHHKPETLRTFAIGHALEDRVIEWLKIAEYSISHQQAELLGKYGQPIGHIDGIAHDGEKHRLLEIKTSANKYFKDWAKNGAPEKYKAQAQIYMHHSAQLSKRGGMLDEVIWVVLNKDTSEIMVDVQPYEPAYAALQTERMHNVIESEDLPPKEESFLCNMCSHKAVCQGEKCAEISCRTCAQVSVVEGKFECQFGNRECQYHVFHPGMIEPLGYKLEGIDHERRALVYDKFVLVPDGVRFKEQATFTSQEFKDCHEAGLIKDENLMALKASLDGVIVNVQPITL